MFSKSCLIRRGGLIIGSLIRGVCLYWSRCRLWLGSLFFLLKMKSKRKVCIFPYCISSDGLSLCTHSLTLTHESKSWKFKTASFHLIVLETAPGERPLCFTQVVCVTGVSLKPAEPALCRYYLLLRRLIFCAGGRQFKIYFPFLFKETHYFHCKSLFIHIKMQW